MDLQKKLDREEKETTAKLKRYSEFKSVKVNKDRIDFDLSVEHVEELMNQHNFYLDDIKNYKFNIFNFS